MSRDDEACEEIIWRMVGALKSGEEPAPGNVAKTLNELAEMAGKEPLEVGGSERLEYERVK